MFGPPGTLYVYFVYGMHWCVNLVCGPEGTAGAVLLRGGEVVVGRERAVARRGSDRDLARGPARLAQAMGLDGAWDGADLRVGRSDITVCAAVAGEPPQVRCGPRVGVVRAALTPWRFWIDGDPAVGPYRPAGPRRGRDAGGSRA
jgi:DNA-3-methyladenine glycosylase